MTHDHAATPAVYEGRCDRCDRLLRRVLQNRAWDPHGHDDAFPIGCAHCDQAESMAYRVFLVPAATPAFGEFGGRGA